MIVIFFSNFLADFYFHDVRALESIDVERGIVYENGKRSFSEPFKDIANRSGGIVQLIDADGLVLHSTREGLLPESYEKEELITITEQERVHAWKLDEQEMLLFRPFTSSDELLRNLQSSPSFPVLSDEDKQMLIDRKASFGLVDLTDGANLSDSETVSLIDILGRNVSMNEREELLSFTTLSSGNIAYVRMENPYFQALEPTDLRLVIKMIKWFFGFHIFLLLFTLGFSLLIGRNYVKPVFYFMKWIERLALKQYKRPDDRTMRTKRNRFKRKYRIYEDIDESLRMLSEKLETDERTILRTEKLREDWITGLSHDLKTPLSSIYGYANMLSSMHDWTPAEVRAFAKTMVEKSSYMDVLINELTYTYQLKSGGVSFNKVRTDFTSYIKDYAERSDWAGIRKPSGGKQLFVDIDQNRFERVLDNVVGNAVKHTSAGTAVHLEVEQVGENCVRLDIRDEGGGIPEEMMENLFTRYYRGTNTTTDDSGTGLGLTIAQQLVSVHGGEIKVASSEAGTTISILLPLSDPFH